MKYEDIKTPQDAILFIENEVFHGRDKEKFEKVKHVIKKLFVIEQLKLNGNVVKNIQKAACQTTGISKDALYFHCRKTELVETRNLIWYMLKLNTDLGSTTMGIMFGFDHATVLHGIKTIKNRISIKDNSTMFNLIKIKSYFQENLLDIDNGL